MMTRTHIAVLPSTLACSQRQAAVEVLAVAGATALAALVRIPLPFTPVPFTLQTFIVLAAPFAVGVGRASAGLALYVCLGLTGAPWFAASAGVGPTLGYLLAFLVVPGVVRWFRHPALGILAGAAMIHVAGTAWLALWLGISPLQAAVLGSLPFVPGDLLKAAGACALVPFVAPAPPRVR